MRRGFGVGDAERSPGGVAMIAVSETPDTKMAYVLITPARNEAAFIERTIQSVINQKTKPDKWVIVSDGSTDGTDEIVQRYAAGYDWIEFVRMPDREERHFSGKVHAFNAGLAKVQQLDYDLIGNLDGDVSFEPDYFEYLVGQFARNSRLGLAGTNYWEGSLRYDYRFTNIEDVAGACQLFRRQCFEAIGGYKPIKCGGIDLVAVLSARMHGWETRTFTERHLIHYRPQGTANSNMWLRCFNDGKHDYLFGNHALWEIFRAAYRMTKKPFVIGGCLVFVAFIVTTVRKPERPVTDDLIRFRRKEQLQRLRTFLKRVLTAKSKQPDGGAFGVQTKSC
jgi:poly-beta-1,6-N-acetyl-D-glucosamine synthase